MGKAGRLKACVMCWPAFEPGKLSRIPPFAKFALFVDAFPTSFAVQKRYLAFDPPAIAAEALILANNPMTRYNKSHRVRRASTSHSAHRGRTADRARDLRIRTGGSVWNLFE